MRWSVSQEFEVCVGQSVNHDFEVCVGAGQSVSQDFEVCVGQSVRTLRCVFVSQSGLRGVC